MKALTLGQTQAVLIEIQERVRVFALPLQTKLSRNFMLPNVKITSPCSTYKLYLAYMTFLTLTLTGFTGCFDVWIYDDILQCVFAMLVTLVP